MAKKFMIRKVHINSKNKQLTVPLSRKEIKIKEPTLKFDEDLFVKLEFLRRKKNGNRSRT